MGGPLFGSTEISGERPINENKNFADKTPRAPRETFEKASAATQQSAKGAEESFSAVAEGIRDFNVRLMEMAQLNTVAALDFVREMSTAKGSSEAAALWSSHTQRQFETLTEQSKELTGAGAENRDVKRRADSAQLWECSQRDYLNRSSRRRGSPL